MKKLWTVLIFLLLVYLYPVETTEALSEDVKIPILMYHHFVEGTPPNGSEGEIISIHLFEKQLKYLQTVGFNTISLSDLRDYLYHGKSLPPNPLVITIDDGYESNYSLAFPVLQKLNMKANINIVVHSRGKKPGHFQHFTWEQAREMVNSGLIEIGSHTYKLHNEKIQQLPKESISNYTHRIYKDFLMSRELMIACLETEPFILAYPYGIYNEISQQIAYSMGFSIQLSVRPGVVTKESDPLALERINVRGDESPEEVLRNIYSYMNIEKPIPPADVLLKNSEEEYSAR